jgi:hypothetical protein
MKIYIIKVDGKYYCGDGDEYEAQIPANANSGFQQLKDFGYSGIKLSDLRKDAHKIMSKTNVKSHFTKIIRCIKEPELIEIISIGEMK